MNPQVASEFKVREVVTLEKFEIEDYGRRLVETIKIENGEIVSVEHPAFTQGG